MKFLHRINKKGKGGLTLAYEIITHEQGKSLRIGIAQCSTKDSYCKKIGAAIAKENFNKNPFTMVVKGSYKNIQQRIFADLPSISFYLNRIQTNHAN